MTGWREQNERSCHSERSEESLRISYAIINGILRFAQDDTGGSQRNEKNKQAVIDCLLIEVLCMISRTARCLSFKKAGIELKKNRMVIITENEWYMCIDMKSFFASVECAERRLDPFTTDLVVADTSRGKGTICLAVTPSLKKKGVKSRCRLYEIPENISFMQVDPRMKKYIEYSAEVYGIYLKYFSKDDIHVYSVDEAFIYVTPYLKLYGQTPEELGETVRKDILSSLGLYSSVGIGTNLYLAKIALDITAKKSPVFMGVLTEEKYKKTLWDHTPLTDFWMIGSQTEKRLRNMGISTMRELANYPDPLLKREFGIDYEIMKDHALGREPVRMEDIKSYKTKARSRGTSQVLPRDYSFSEGRIIVREMTDTLCAEILRNGLCTSNVVLCVHYSDRNIPPAKASRRFDPPVNSFRKICDAATDIYDSTVMREYQVRKIDLSFGNVEKEEFSQISFFDYEKEEKERKQNNSLEKIRRKYGINAIFKGIDLLSCATLLERNHQIGGHKE